MPLPKTNLFANAIGSLLTGGDKAMPFGMGIPTKKQEPPKDDLLQNSVNSLISHPGFKMERRAETAPDYSTE